MDNKTLFIELYEEIKREEKKLRELKEMYEDVYQKMIDEVEKAKDNRIKIKDYVVSRYIRRSLEVIDMEKTWKHVFNNYPDKLRIDREEIEKLLASGKRIPGATLVDGVYLKVKKV